VLADDFWRLTHDDSTGRPLLHARAVGLGLAAALLGELATSHHLTAADGRLTILADKAPACSTAHVVLDELRAEADQGHSVRTWLTYLARTAPDRVAERLTRAGHVRPAKRSKLFGGQVTHVPVDSVRAAAPISIITTQLRLLRPLNYHEGCLAGFAWAAGMEGRLLDGAPTDSARYLQHVVGNLWPPVGALVSEARGAISDAVLSSR